MVIMSRDCLMCWKALDGNSKALPSRPVNLILGLLHNILLSPARFLRHELLRTGLALVGRPSGNLQESAHKHTQEKKTSPERTLMTLGRAVDFCRNVLAT